MERWGRHLDGAERAVILAEHRRGTRQREIGRFLGRSASTIRRELGRGRVGAGLARPSVRRLASASIPGGGCGAGPGHWDGHLLKGAANRSSVGTLVECKIRFVTLAKMEGNGAAAVLEGFTRQMLRQDRGPSGAAQACRTLPGVPRAKTSPATGASRWPATPSLPAA